MRTAKIAQTVYLLVSICFMFSARASTLSQVLDLNQVPQFSYFGQDELRHRAPCHLELDPPQRDFAGRPYQTIRAWVDSNLYTMSTKYRGAARQINPDSQTGANQLRFKVQAEGYEIVLLTEGDNTNNVLTFQVNDLSGVSGHTGTLVNCTGVRNSRR